MANNNPMENNTRNLNGFPTDNSPSTQLKYDIVTSKLMSGIENHQRRKASVGSPIASFGLIGSILQGVVALIVLCRIVLYWIWKRL